MTRLSAALLAAYVVVESSGIYGLTVPIQDSTFHITCDEKTKDSCYDLAEALNMARVNRAMRVCISEDEPLRFVPCK